MIAIRAVFEITRAATAFTEFRRRVVFLGRMAGIRGSATRKTKTVAERWRFHFAPVLSKRRADNVAPWYDASTYPRVSGEESFVAAPPFSRRNFVKRDGAGPNNVHPFTA